MKLQHIFKDLLAEDFKSQTKKYLAQGIEPEIVRSYIEKFKHIRDNKFREMFDTNLDISVPVDKRNNIDAYDDFHELEQLVDYVGGRRQGVSTLKSSKEEIEVDGTAIYNDGIVEIYYADTPRACIKYKGKFPYSWCVARSDSSNMFYTYRFKPYEPAFYFVKNIKATEKEFGVWNMTKNVFNGRFKNPYHFFVIQVPKNADIEDDDTDQYIVTSANNDGDTQMSWKDILKKCPALKPARKAFQPKPFTPEERAKNERFKNGISDKEFAKLSYEDKRSYLDIYPTIARPITHGQLIELPDDLLNLYVSFGIGLDDQQFAFIKPKKDILKRYTQISKRKLEEYLKRTSKYERKQLKMAFTELAILSDEEISSYLKSLDQMEINQFINDFGEDKFEFLEKHLPDQFTPEHKSLKTLILSANGGDEQSLAKIQEMVPEDVSVFFSKGYMVIDVYSYGNNYLEKNMESDVYEIYDKLDWNSWGGDYGYSDNYFDGDDEGMKNTVKHYIEGFITSNTSLANDFKLHNLTWDYETIKDLLDTYKELEGFEQTIEGEYSSSTDSAKDDAWREVRDEIKKICYVLDNEEVKIGLGPLLMFLSKNELFSTDKKVFIDNVINLLNTILDGYDVPSSYDVIWERINEAGYNFNDLDEAAINRSLESAISDALDKFSDDNPSDEPSDEEEPNLVKLKSQVIGLLNDTLKGLGQDPASNIIENDLVKIEIDRKRFQLDGKVYIKLTDKKNNQSHEGYVYIKDIPSYFTNYKLFEQIQRQKRLMKY